MRGGKSWLGWWFASLWWLGFVVGNAQAETAEALAEQAIEAAELGKSDEAIRLASRAIELNPRLPSPYKTRARERFRSGQLRESVVDFDQFVKLEPQAEPRQWERGIAYYYAGEFGKGAAQFELYQTFDGHDVENSVWRFLCLAPTVGVERAQATMLPIENDRRIPMKQIYDLFRGKCQPADVLAAVTADKPDLTSLAGRQFYAHLYLGLWHHAHGRVAESRRWIELAAADSLRDNPRLNRYMWDVARIHRQQLARRP